MNIVWLGPPEHSVGLIGIGLVTPGDELTLDDDVAAALIAEGRAREVEVNATPAAIDQADKAGVDITTITGTGTDGKITKADVNKEVS